MVERSPEFLLPRPSSGEEPKVLMMEYSVHPRPGVFHHLRPLVEIPADRHRAAGCVLQAQHFAPRPRPERDAVSAGCGPQERLLTSDALLYKLHQSYIKVSIM